MSYYRDRTKCGRCGGRVELWTVYRWLPARGAGWDRWPEATISVTLCADREACMARMNKRSARAQQRGKMLVIREAAAPDAPRGVCRWCGKRIPKIVSGVDVGNDRRRSYHRGDRGEPDCARLHGRSRAWSARDALRLLADGAPMACVSCGLVVEEGWGRGVVGAPAWEADHEVPLEDGGAHDMANLVVRCVPCHRAKTAEENVLRARARRLGVTVADLHA